MSNTQTEKIKTQVPKLVLDKFTVITTSSLLIVFIILSFMLPNNMNTILEKSLKIFSDNTGIFYQISVVFVLGSVAYFACSKYGDIKFGDPDEKPEFSTFDWGAMVYCTCSAGGTIYWGAMEPIMHLTEVPFSWVEPGTDSAALYGMAFMLICPLWVWALNVLAALPICYLLYIKKIPLARFTEILVPIFGEKVARGPIGKGANILFIIAIMMSYAGGIAVSIPIAASCISTVFGIAHTQLLNLLVLGGCTVIYIWSAFMGLNKGIRVLSRFNAHMCIFLAVVFLLAGPTMFILEHMSFSFGLAMDNFWTMLLATDPYWDGTFATNWVQFQILWNYASAPLLAMFIARVSRGRTVRQILLGGLLCGIIGLWLNFGITGCYSLWLQQTGLIDLELIMQTESKAAALIAILETLPQPKFMMLFVLVFIVVFSATTIDSCAFVASGACCKEITPDQEPPRSNRIYWAILQGSLGLAFMMIGDLTACRVLGSYSGFLMVFLVLIAYVAWYKYAAEYKNKYMPASFVLPNLDAEENNQKNV